MQWAPVSLHHICTAYWQISLWPQTPRCKTNFYFCDFYPYGSIGTKFISTLVLLAPNFPMTSQFKEWLEMPRSGISLQLGFSASVTKLAAFLRIRFCFFLNLRIFWRLAVRIGWLWACFLQIYVLRIACFPNFIELLLVQFILKLSLGVFV